MKKQHRVGKTSVISVIAGFGMLLIGIGGCSKQNPTQASKPLQQGNQKATLMATPKLSSPPTGVLFDASEVQIKNPDDFFSGLTSIEEAQMVINFLALALMTFRCHTGRYPDQEEGLQVLVEPLADVPQDREWLGPYSAKAHLMDPWGTRYQYRWLDHPEILFDLRSFGPDGVESEDDLSLADLPPDSAQFAHRRYIDNFVQDFEAQSQEDAPDENFPLASKTLEP